MSDVAVAVVVAGDGDVACVPQADGGAGPGRTRCPSRPEHGDVGVAVAVVVAGDGDVA